MSEDKITALAREYAEEIYPHEEGEDLGQMNFLRNNAIRHISSTLKMLLRRYVLVEKSEVEEEYHEAKICRTHVERYGAQWGALTAKMAFMERLFPDLGKEVES